MKNVFTILFLALVGSFVAGLPAAANERRAISSNAFEIAARALELVPRAQVGSRASNQTESVPRSLSARQGNSTSSFGSSGSGSGNEARSEIVPRAFNSSDDNEARSLFARKGNSTDAETEKRAPGVKRVHVEARAFNSSSA
ncbi:uncharacterized protein GGS22DRAFT_116649 [Annulohypoxylon maeteangense]|uniref:uncharacterized protein n=1 Tax=Annulohypoxylon maeteangense TaxID=1927788 RepID=UPI002007F1D3|nr:uncharacterized protein GGS22DRAFT_116649 [Annulohypoxylon maeteangense]KAI0886700.1 hypothetical protein GGS22DRAFT_116649 [Annulohypoxylon maeteangense]